MRLYEATGEGGVFPQLAAKTITVNSKKKHLTSEEFVKYATDKGKTSRRLVEAIVESSAYKTAGNKDKVKMVKLAYEYANELAKAEVSEYDPDKWVLNCRKAKRNGVPEDVFISLKVQTTDIESLKDSEGKTITNSESLLKMQKIYEVKGLSDTQRQMLFESFGIGKTVRKYNKAAVNEKLSAMRRKGK